MAMNRRNVLVGLGAVAVGGGAAFGSGAFSQVEAERTVNFDTSGDASALLGLTAGSGATGIVSTPTSTANNSNAAVDVVRFDETDINGDATTRFNRVIEVVNNGSDPVDFWIPGTDSNGNTISGLGPSSELDFENAGTSLVGTRSNDAVQLAASGNSGDRVEIDIVLDMTGANDAGDLPTTVTFTAETQGGATTSTPAQ